MKNLQLLLILTITLLITSCGGNDPLSTTIADTTWKLVSIEQKFCDDPTENIPTIEAVNDCTAFQGDTACNYTMSFNAGGNGSYQFSEDSDVQMNSFTYTVNDDINEITFCEGTNDCAMLNLGGNTMTLVNVQSRGCVVNAVFEKS